MDSVAKRIDNLTRAVKQRDNGLATLFYADGSTVKASAEYVITAILQDTAHSIHHVDMGSNSGRFTELMNALLQDVVK